MAIPPPPRGLQRGERPEPSCRGATMWSLRATLLMLHDGPGDDERMGRVLKKSDLYSSLWKSRDELRGGRDASQYKDYIPTLLFVKYLTDKVTRGCTLVAGRPRKQVAKPAKSLEQRVWDAADALRGNNIEASLKNPDSRALH